ncbi:MAG: MYXO-CTERM domain-containing protein [Myxococcota bacterium]|jgi:MYXO-CTERM domain-containing protein
MRAEKPITADNQPLTSRSQCFGPSFPVPLVAALCAAVSCMFASPAGAQTWQTLTVGAAEGTATFTMDEWGGTGYGGQSASWHPEGLDVRENVLYHTFLMFSDRAENENRADIVGYTLNRHTASEWFMPFNLGDDPNTVLYSDEVIGTDTRITEFNLPILGDFRVRLIQVATTRQLTQTYEITNNESAPRTLTVGATTDPDYNFGGSYQANLGFHPFSTPREIGATSLTGKVGGYLRLFGGEFQGWRVWQGRRQGVYEAACFSHELGAPEEHLNVFTRTVAGYGASDGQNPISGDPRHFDNPYGTGTENITGDSNGDGVTDIDYPADNFRVELGAGDIALTLQSTLLLAPDETRTIVVEHEFFGSTTNSVYLSDQDEDGIPDLTDGCFGNDGFPDTDDDGVCEDIDECIGNDASPDTDDDGICEDIDECIGDDSVPDTDGDGICEDIDECLGDDASPDTDDDGICEDIDQCVGDDAFPDTDDDGICEDIDLCLGDDASGDSDEDGYCDDLDCGVNEDTRYPGAEELCNGLDDDCDEWVPEGEVDVDGDLVLVCGGDCDDAAASVYEGAPELCDAVDNDCDGDIDEDFEDTNDNDILDCAEVDEDEDGFFPYDGDCDNTDASVYVGAPELCDGLDNNCDGTIPVDERDVDGDNLYECNGDCDDAVATTYDGAPELCDDVDNDCDNGVDEDYEDSNEDGVVDCLEQDVDGDGFTPSQGDCDDNEASANASADEICDGLDNDCDGDVPEDEQDLDEDGVRVCDGDCDDGNSDVYPGNTEVNDGIDNDCDDVLLADEKYVAGGCDCATGGSSAPVWPLLPLFLAGMFARRSRNTRRHRHP